MFLERLKRKASKSKCVFRVAAVGLNKKHELVGISFNTPRFMKHGGGLHAEARLMKRYGSLIKTMYICRTGKDSELLPIRPCSKCMEIAKSLGIKIISVKGKEN